MSGQQRVSSRLAELGIELPPVVAPVANYVPALRVGNLVYTSGQLPVVDGVLQQTGIVGADLTAQEAAGLARMCALNAIAAAADVVGGVDALSRPVKVTGFVASTANFTEQPAVINGASDLLGDVFGTPHARSAVGSPALPRNTPVEVEVIFEVAD